MTTLSSRCRSHPFHFEALEGRQLRAGDAVSATTDIHLRLNSDGTVVHRSVQSQVRVAALSQFTWYDATNLHSLNQHSNAFDPVVVDGYAMWPWVNGTRTPGPTADEAGVRLLARESVENGHDLVVLDNETWHFDVRFYPRAVVDKTIADMKQVIAWMRDEEPSIKIGIYGYMSQSDDNSSGLWDEATQFIAQGNGWYEDNLAPIAERYADWQATSEYLRPLAESVDYMFPVLYTGTDNVNEWERTAKATILDSRRYGKPVIPFLWPYYHEAIGPAKALTEIPAADWQRELELVEQYADSAVIWSSRSVVGDEDWVSVLDTVAGVSSSRPAPLLSEPPSTPIAFNASPSTPLWSSTASTFGSLPIDGQTDEDHDPSALLF